MAAAARALAKAKICEERLRLGYEYLEALRSVIRIQDQKAAIVMSGGTRLEQLERFGSELDRARARWDGAKAAYVAHVKIHSCSRAKALFNIYLDAVDTCHFTARACAEMGDGVKSSAFATALIARREYWNHVRIHGCREADRSRSISAWTSIRQFATCVLKPRG